MARRSPTTSFGYTAKDSRFDPWQGSFFFLFSTHFFVSKFLFFMSESGEFYSPIRGLLELLLVHYPRSLSDYAQPIQTFPSPHNLETNNNSRPKLQLHFNCFPILHWARFLFIFFYYKISKFFCHAFPYH